MAADLAGTVSVCSIRAGMGLFGIETSEIREVLGAATPQPVPLAPEYIAGVVPYRGDVLTTVSFRVLLGLEKKTGPNCVLVLEDDDNQRFGLMVDGVGGVLDMPGDALEPNPGALDARSLALFDGVYRLPITLMVRLDPRRLRPLRLACNRVFDVAKTDAKGELE
jgi:purine-binding chemotaxis protein CheW